MAHNLKVGDTVRYKGMNPDLGRLGFATGETYTVKGGPGVELSVVSDCMGVVLIGRDGGTTQWTDSFVKVSRCPVLLTDKVEAIGYDV